MLQRVLKPTGLLFLGTVVSLVNALEFVSQDSSLYKAEEKTIASAHLSSSSPPPRLLRLSANQGGVRHKVMHDFLSSIFLGIAIVVVFLVALCVIRCRCARVCPCLCGEEAALARAELMKEGRTKGRTVMIDEEDEDILAQVGGKEGVVEGGAATVAGGEEEAKEGGEEDRKEGGGRVKEEDEESEASLPPSTPLKSLSSSLLALLGMNGRGTPTAEEGGGEEDLRKKVEQELARLQQEGGGEGGEEELKKKFELQMQRLQEQEGGIEGGLAEESKEYRAVE